MTSRLLERVTAGLRERTIEASDPRLTVGGNVVLVEVTRPDCGRVAGLAHRPPAETGPDFPADGTGAGSDHRTHDHGDTYT